MNIDELIKDSIDESTAGRIPAPDLSRIHRNGRRRSAVRVGAATLATIGVLAAGTYTVQGIGGPGESDEVPVSIRGQGPAVTYVSGARAHFGDHTYTAQHAEYLGMSAATVAGLVYIGDDGIPYLLEPDGNETALGDSLTPRGEKDTATSMAASADRETVAWSSVYDGKMHLYFFDAETANITATDTLDCDSTDRCGAIQSIDDGAVAVTMATPENNINLDYTYAWDPSRPEGEQLYPMTDSGTVVAAVGNGHVVLDGDGPAFGGPDREPLDPSVEISRLPKRQYAEDIRGEMSSDGDWRLVNGAKTLAINVETGEKVRLDDGDSSDAIFDDDGSVLVIADASTSHRLVDCDPATSRCVTIEEDLEGDDPVFPGEDAS